MTKIIKLATLTAAVLLAVLAVPTFAGQYDGTRWSVGVTSTKDYDSSCQICRAQNGRPGMSECGGPEAMKPGVPYIIYCGNGVWGNAGTAPGTRFVGPGQTVGSYTAGPKDYWTVK